MGSAHPLLSNRYVKYFSFTPFAFCTLSFLLKKREGEERRGERRGGEEGRGERRKGEGRKERKKGKGREGGKK